MISDEKQYEFVSKRVADMADSTLSSLKVFIPNFSAILAGSIWLRQENGGPAPASYIYLSDALVALLTLTCVVMVLDNLRSWWGYRKLLMTLLKGSSHPAPQPKLLPAAIIEFTLCGAMIATCALFVTFNPFSVMS